MYKKEPKVQAEVWRTLEPVKTCYNDKFDVLAMKNIEKDEAIGVQEGTIREMHLYPDGLPKKPAAIVNKYRKVKYKGESYVFDNVETGFNNMEDIREPKTKKHTANCTFKILRILDPDEDENVQKDEYKVMLVAVATENLIDGEHIFAK